MLQQKRDGISKGTPGISVKYDRRERGLCNGQIGEKGVKKKSEKGLNVNLTSRVRRKEDQEAWASINLYGFPFVMEYNPEAQSPVMTKRPTIKKG